jgi:hypothetical protein
VIAVAFFGTWSDDGAEFGSVLHYQDDEAERPPLP